MKKVLVTLIALSLPTFALADATKGFYVQADAGHATVKARNDDASGSVKGFSPRISAGYDFGNFRVAADYTHYKSFKSDSETPTTITKTKLNSKVLVCQQFTILTLTHLLNPMSEHA